MDFAPLKWVVGTLTFWHLGILLAIAVLPGGLGIGRLQLAHFDFAELVFRLVFFAFFYVIGALVLGQAFGDKYRFAQVWPTSATLGVILAAIAVFRFNMDGPMSLEDGLIVLVTFALFWGLALNLFLYVLPRGVGWFGLIEMPKASWGVTLPPSP